MKAETVNDERMRVWLCEKGHVDDHHLEVPGNELCSRCGGITTATTIAGLVSSLERMRDVLYSAHEFTQSVTHWNGQPDDRADTQRDIEAALAETETEQSVSALGGHGGAGVVTDQAKERVEQRWSIRKGPDHRHGMKQREVIGPDTEPIEVVPASLLEERDRVREALAELVRLKDGPRDEEYHQLKPEAWDRARETLAALDGEGEA